MFYSPNLTYFRSQEFIRVGYYINNDYADPELRESPPALPQFDKLQRNILASNPRVTRFMVRNFCSSVHK